MFAITHRRGVSQRMICIKRVFDSAPSTFIRARKIVLVSAQFIIVFFSRPDSVVLENNSIVGKRLSMQQVQNFDSFLFLLDA